MNSKAHFNPKSKKQIITFIIMLIVSIIIVVASAFLSKTITEKEKQTANLDSFNVNITTPIAVKDNDFNVTGVENAFDKKGNLVGYVIKTKTTGYNAEVPIETATTVTKDGKYVVGIDILKQEETEYLGVRIQTDDFKNQFKSRKLPVASSSTIEKGSKVDVIAKSTLSSDAVITAVNDAGEYAKTYLVKK